MQGSIVVGLDGSRESLAASDWAAREALRRGLPLRLIQAGTVPGGAAGGEVLPELAVPRDRARRVLREAEDRLMARHPGLCVLGERVPGGPAAALLAASEEAEMTVLGSRGLGQVGGLLVGSVALTTVAHARRPVVLVRAGERAEDEHLPGTAGKPSTRTPCREVLLGLDPAPSCDTLIEFAFDTAALRGAPLRVVHAWSRTDTHPRSSSAGYERALDAEHVTKAGEAVATALQPWREKFPDQSVTVELATGGAASRLLEAASRAGLMVIGRRYRPSRVGGHIGGVTHAVIHFALCPVAVVPHE